jgi:hypothetical protein
MNEFILTLYVCSVVTANCVIPSFEKYTYPKTYSTHYECITEGLLESVEIFLKSGALDLENVNKYELYPKFTCEKKPIIIPEPKPNLDSTPGVNT